MVEPQRGYHSAAHVSLEGFRRLFCSHSGAPVPILTFLHGAHTIWQGLGGPETPEDKWKMRKSLWGAQQSRWGGWHRAGCSPGSDERSKVRGVLPTGMAGSRHRLPPGCRRSRPPATPARPLPAGVGAASLVALQAQVFKAQQEAQMVREGKLDADDLRARWVPAPTAAAAAAAVCCLPGLARWAPVPSRIRPSQAFYHRTLLWVQAEGQRGSNAGPQECGGGGAGPARQAGAQGEAGGAACLPCSWSLLVDLRWLTIKIVPPISCVWAPHAFNKLAPAKPLRR